MNLELLPAHVYRWSLLSFFLFGKKRGYLTKYSGLSLSDSMGRWKPPGGKILSEVTNGRALACCPNFELFEMLRWERTVQSKRKHKNGKQNEKIT